VIRKKLHQLENAGTNRLDRHLSICGRSQESKVVVDQESAKTIRLQPMVEMYLVGIGSNDFLSQLMRLTAQERDLHTRKHGNQGLRDSVWITTMGIGRLDPTQAAGNQQETVWALGHPSQSVDENAAFCRTGMHQVAVLHADELISCGLTQSAFIESHSLRRTILLIPLVTASFHHSARPSTLFKLQNDAPFPKLSLFRRSHSHYHTKLFGFHPLRLDLPAQFHAALKLLLTRFDKRCIVLFSYFDAAVAQ
jgi:hypothetical protein